MSIFKTGIIIHGIEVRGQRLVTSCWNPWQEGKRRRSRGSQGHTAEARTMAGLSGGSQRSEWKCCPRQKKEESLLIVPFLPSSNIIQAPFTVQTQRSQLTKDFEKHRLQESNPLGWRGMHIMRRIKFDGWTLSQDQHLYGLCFVQSQLWNQTAWAQILALLLILYVILDKLINLSKSHLPHL